jgi:hypothetical protein
MSPFLAVRSNSQEDVTETHSMCRLGGTWRPRTSANEPHECLFSDAWPELHLSILAWNPTLPSGANFSCFLPRVASVIHLSKR